MNTPITPPTIIPARNSNIAAEPAFDPVAQTDQAKTEGDQGHRRSITRPGEDRDQPGQFGNRAAAAQGFMGWLRPAAIRTRREAERDLFRDGCYPIGTIPIWAVDRNGRVDFSRPIRRLTEAEALAYLRPVSVSVPLPPTMPPATATPSEPIPTNGWPARLAAFFSNLTRRV